MNRGCAQRVWTEGASRVLPCVILCMRACFTIHHKLPAHMRPAAQSLASALSALLPKSTVERTIAGPHITTKFVHTISSAALCRRAPSRGEKRACDRRCESVKREPVNQTASAAYTM